MKANLNNDVHIKHIEYLNKRIQALENRLAEFQKVDNNNVQ